ncbi:MAG TPA: LacI family DNA-binding transcriptional regulator, partial [Limnochordia bacterium]|nr:LacI family DNA-binding transcriptional regulator [Limnochordia bacterium]
MDKAGVRAITIDDIAKKANVSKATVSKVINSYSGINEKTRQAVLKVMREHNYWPNTTARSLSMQRSYLVGLFMAS